MEVEVSKVLTCFPISMVMPFDTAVGRLNKRNSALMFDETVSLSWAVRESRALVGPSEE